MGLMNKFRKSQYVTAQMKENRVKETITSVMEANPTILSIMAHTDKEDINRLVSTMAERVVESVTNPTNEFLDICKSKGISDDGIREFVSQMTKMFCLCEDTATYDEQLYAVASYFADKPEMYDDLSLFR